MLPGANDNVNIAPGQTVILDVATPPLDCLRIEGTLVADPLLDVAVTANCIEVMQGGTLQIGSANEPHERRVAHDADMIDTARSQQRQVPKHHDAVAKALFSPDE